MKRRRQVPPNSPSDSSTGSPSPGEPVYLAVGKLRRPHGIQGEVLMDILTDFPERLHIGKTLYAGEEHEPIRIAGVRGHDRAKIMRFVGFQTPEEIGRLRNMVVYVKAESLPDLPAGEFYYHEILGLTIVNEKGENIGVLDHILETGANDVYVVKTTEGKELLLPAIEEVILRVDLEKGEIEVRPPEWV